MNPPGNGRFAPSTARPGSSNASSAPAEYGFVGEAREGIGAPGDARHRQRVQGTVMLFVGMAGLGASMLMGEVIPMTIASAGIGGFGLYLSWR